ncbi:MAG TPA: hypothetical protein VFN35_06440 [Ktedonobacteraceae bacterium]|nr:hypothetical protein [Ktedonobacteraceae bacterium]
MLLSILLANPVGWANGFLARELLLFQALEAGEGSSLLEHGNLAQVAVEIAT